MPVAVKGSNFEKTIISKNKGVKYDFKNTKFFYLACWISFVPRGLSIRRTVLSPPIIAESTNFFTKPKYFSITNYEKVKNSNSEL